MSEELMYPTLVDAIGTRNILRFPIGSNIDTIIMKVDFILNQIHSNWMLSFISWVDYSIKSGLQAI